MISLCVILLKISALLMMPREISKPLEISTSNPLLRISTLNQKPRLFKPPLPLKMSTPMELMSTE